MDESRKHYIKVAGLGPLFYWMLDLALDVIRSGTMVPMKNEGVPGLLSWGGHSWIRRVIEVVALGLFATFLLLKHRQEPRTAFLIGGAGYAAYTGYCVVDYFLVLWKK